jgi:cell division protease FtsH
MNDSNNKRSVWSYILPYFFTVLFVVLIVGVIIRQFFSNPSVTFTEGDLDTILRVDVDDLNTITSYDEKTYFIRNVSISTNITTTTVTGDAYSNKDANHASTSFKIILPAPEWTTSASHTKVMAITGADGKVLGQDASWNEVFRARVSDWADLDWVKKSTTKDFTVTKFDNTDPYTASWWDTWGPTIIELVLILIVGFFFFRMLNSSVNGANRQAMDFNKSPARREDASKVRFSDVAGCDEEKAEMVEMVEYLKDPKKYSKYGARLPKGVLLIGNPGTGKTLLAKAVAGEAGVPFYSISGSDFVEMFVGVGAGRVRDLFHKAKQTAPCIVFIDEIDAVGRQRGAGLGGGNDEREQTLNQLLVEMDGFEYNAGILVIAATNRDDVLDPALLRPGRFDRIITVSLPDAAGREAIFKVHARNKKIDPSVDFHALSKRTVGFSGADIENILNEAAILAVRFHKESVGMAEIDEAIDRRIAGPAKSGKGMNDQERKEVAFHEAGHAVIGLVLPYSEKVQKITIIPRGRTGGHVLMTPEDDRFLLTKKELLAQITGLLGGRASEEIFFDDISTGAENDIQEATRLARMMVTEFGMSDLGPIQYEQNSGSVFLGRDYTNTQRNFSSEVAFEIDKAVREIIDTAHKQAIDILTEHKAQVTLIADTLLQKETITAEEIDSLIKTGKLPEKPQASVGEKLTPEEQAVIDGKISAENQLKTEEKPVTPTPTAPEAPKADTTSEAKPAEKPAETEANPTEAKAEDKPALTKKAPAKKAAPKKSDDPKSTDDKK